MTTAAADTFTRMLHAIDRRDWTGVRDAFANCVAIDYSSLFGEPAATVEADTLVAGWRAFGGAFDVTQHLTGPFVTSEDRDGVTAQTHVRAYHRTAGARGGEVWMVAGHYEIRVERLDDRWKIAGITLRVFYQEGNLELPDLARQRAATSA
jgi:hypothetical protein